MSLTRKLADMRQRHWLEYKELVGLPAEHDYKDRDLAIEGAKEQADFVNYAEARGCPDWMVLAATTLGDAYLAWEPTP